jgi:hypothetical protein
MRFTELHKRAKIRDKYWTFDMTINISTHFACLPGAQTPFSVWSCVRGFGINLLPQQRGGFKYRAVNRLFVIQLTDSRIEQRDYVVHPFAWPCRTYLRDSQRLSEVHLHNSLHTPPAARPLDVKSVAEQHLSCGVYVPGLLMRW